MNQDDRRALVDLGRKYVPHLYEHVTQPETLVDSAVLELTADAFHFLHQENDQPVPDEPLDALTLESLDAVLRQHGVKYHDHRIVDEPIAGGRTKRRYVAVVRAAQLEDVLDHTVNGGVVSLVMADGRSYEFPLN